MFFWYTKFLMNFMALIAILGFGSVLYYAYDTTGGAPAPVNNIAPFRENVASTNTGLFLAPEKARRSLAEAHLSDTELKTWLTTIISEALTIANKDYYNAMFQLDQYFTDEGFKQYETYLENAKIPAFVQEGAYSVNVVVEEPPISLNSGSIDGAYRWLYQVPITLSFVPVNRASGEIVNQKLLLRVQVTRVFFAGNPNKVRLESWTVKPRS